MRKFIDSFLDALGILIPIAVIAGILFSIVYYASKDPWQKGNITCGVGELPLLQATEIEAFPRHNNWHIRKGKKVLVTNATCLFAYEEK